MLHTDTRVLNGLHFKKSGKVNQLVKLKTK